MKIEWKDINRVRTVVLGAAKKAASTSNEAKSAVAGAAVGGWVASAAGAHVGIVALGTGMSGAALLPALGTVAVGAVVGYAAYKGIQDVIGKIRRPDHQPQVKEHSSQVKEHGKILPSKSERAG